MIKTKVVEKSTGELSFGAGFSTQDGVLGDIRLRERNLLGRGQDLRASLTAVAASPADRHQLHRALLPRPRPRRRLRPVPDPDQFPAAIVVRSDQHRRHAAPRLSADREFAPFGALHAARRQIHNVDNDASIFIREEEGQRVDIADRSELHLRSPRRSLPAQQRLFHQAGPGSGRIWRRQPVHPARGASRVLLLHHSRRGVQSQWRGGATSWGLAVRTCT